MPEVQKTVQTGELTQRFIEFVMMHAQNAALFLASDLASMITGQSIDVNGGEVFV